MPRSHVAVALGWGGGTFAESRLDQDRVGSLLRWQVCLGTGGKQVGTSSHGLGRSGRRVGPISEELGRSRRRFVMLCVQAGVTVPFWTRVALAFPSTRYPETVSTLHAAFASEMAAYQRYRHYTRKAHLDGYMGIAYLFVALATSELIHAQNYHRVLALIGVEPPHAIDEVPPVSTTKDNLISAAEAEIRAIEQLYPALLRRA